uniref:Fibronectin type-III domain-containing protein n=1 Tax=Acrobeloides nanus TaxID=290746 RepID=A0A914BU89_9BILA
MASQVGENPAIVAVPIWPYGVPMEPIPEEEDHENLGSASTIHGHPTSPTSGRDGGHMGTARSITPGTKRLIESKQRQREIYTSEQVDTLVSTVPKNNVPDAWNQLTEEQVVVDPNMTSTYITESIAGPASARGTTYSYTYETHLDEPETQAVNFDEYTEFVNDENLERHSTQTQKITRMTKITTTRSIKQVPVDPNELYFDSEGNPIMNGYGVVSLENEENYGINLSREQRVEYEEVSLSSPSSSNTAQAPPPPAYVHYGVTPSAPGVPQLVDLDENEVALAWLRPDFDGSAGAILGYRVEFRRNPKDPWEPAHDDLLGETECRITNLDPLSEYQFRVLAANPAGFGLPSTCTPPIQLRPKYDIPPAIDNAPLPPGQPKVVAVEGDRATIEWTPAPFPQTGISPISGYVIEYRAAGTTNWIPSNDFPVPGYRYEVSNLRPNGEYEFRVSARTEEGILSEPSQSTGFVRIKPAVPMRSQHPYNPDLSPPGQPQVIEADSTWVQLQWSSSVSEEFMSVTYLVESREIGDLNWYASTPKPIAGNELIIENLNNDSTYEFRVSTVAPDGSQSEPSETSDVVRLRPLHRVGSGAQRPERPSAPEYLDFDGGNSVTLCWLPAKSLLPVQGYEVEFRDFQQDATQWFKVTDQIVHSCKTTVGYLIHGHQYQFRIIAKNAVGYSDPSDASPPITIGTSLKDTKYIEAERHGSVSLLQEMIRESPPLPDRDDSPPPIYRQPNASNLQWRDPTLKEVIDYLLSPDKNIQLDASGYLQHLTYNDNMIKEETRNLGGIPNLIRLLDSDQPEIVRNCCGCLKNLSFGKENDTNKKVINQSGGVRALGIVLRTTSDMHVKEEATGALWNISSCDDLKEPVLNQVAEIIVNYVVIPGSGYNQGSPGAQRQPDRHYNTHWFRNGTGLLRNISAANQTARKALRHAPNLIEALLHFLSISIQRNQVDTRAVENVVCLLRNLSYRVQEVVDPNYSPSANIREVESSKSRTRSKSAPSGSPKGKKKGLFNKKNKKDVVEESFPTHGPSLLWHPDTVKMYLRLLQDSSNSETLEASAAAIQNLAACQFDGSVQVRTNVRIEKGLPILVELLGLQDDKVVCAVTTALRNLALDPRNLELIGKYALKDLIEKLPKMDQQQRSPNISDSTIGAVLGILFEAVRSSVALTKNLHEVGGTERLRKLAKSYPAYGMRVCKYATQVLYMMWQHKDLHDLFKRSGLKEVDFYSGHTGGKHSARGDTATLSRPISSQGAERPARLRSETLDDSAESAQGRYGAMGSTASIGKGSNPRYADHSPVTPNSDRSAPSSQYRSAGHYAGSTTYERPPYSQVPGEPLYAAVHKRNGHRGSIGGDSWV